MVDTGQIRNSRQLFILMDQDLHGVLECTEGIGEEIIDGKLFTPEQKDDILESLEREGIVFRSTLGREWVFSKVDSTERKGILISFAPMSDELFTHEIRADIAEELNNVLRREIKEHKFTQTQLKERTSKLQAIFDSTALFIWTVDRELTLTSFNKRFSQNMKRWFDREVTLKGAFYEEAYEENTAVDERFRSELTAAFSCMQRHFELEIYTHDADRVWIEVFMEPVCDDEGKVIEVSCIAFETTDKKLIETQNSLALKEKETLLQEIHHRVKNNLQIISSILNLQSSYVKDESTLGILKESQNRIRSMSYIHERLYMNKTFGSVEMKDYISGLVSQLVYSYSMDSERVSLAMEMDEVILNLDQAIPCGLIINEIVSNTLKYAFPDQRQGTLEITVREKDDRMAIFIADDGIGIPATKDIEQSDSLGMQLIFSLTEQLDGEIEFSGERGTKYLITFDKIKEKELWPETRYS